MRILGIDPGSHCTGYGIIDQTGFVVSFITCGVIRVKKKAVLADRLLEIHEGISEVIEANSLDIAAIENVFMARNPSSALKLGQARGVLMLAARQHRLPLYEYSAKEVKQAVVGYGQADKAQIQQAVRALLSLSACPSQDAADALAVAMCCANHQAMNQATANTRS